jgi:hypothetical protein
MLSRKREARLRCHPRPSLGRDRRERPLEAESGGGFSLGRSATSPCRDAAVHGRRSAAEDTRDNRKIHADQRLVLAIDPWPVMPPGKRFDIGRRFAEPLGQLCGCVPGFRLCNLAHRPASADRPARKSICSAASVAPLRVEARAVDLTTGSISQGSDPAVENLGRTPARPPVAKLCEVGRRLMVLPLGSGSCLARRSKGGA